MHRLLPLTKCFGTAKLTKQELANGLIMLHMMIHKGNIKVAVEFLATNTEYRRFKTAIFHDMKRSLRAQQMRMGYTRVSVEGAE